MSQWHRENPELVGTAADPWMIHESYRRNVPPPCDIEGHDYVPAGGGLLICALCEHEKWDDE